MVDKKQYLKKIIKEEVKKILSEDINYEAIEDVSTNFIDLHQSLKRTLDSIKDTESSKVLNNILEVINTQKTQWNKWKNDYL